MSFLKNIEKSLSNCVLSHFTLFKITKMCHDDETAKRESEKFHTISLVDTKKYLI